jgi:hypothetical protein
MIKILIVLIHLLINVLTNYYIFYTKNNKYDYYYLIYVYFLILHWTFLNTECIVSYLFKKYKNNDYVLGSDLKNDDIYYIAGKYKSLFGINNNIFLTLNIYMVCKRNNIKDYLIFLFILLFQSCSFCKYYFIDHHINTNFKCVNKIIQISLIYFGLYIFSNQDKIIQT